MAINGYMRMNNRQGLPRLSLYPFHVSLYSADNIRTTCDMTTEAEARSFMAFHLTRQGPHVTALLTHDALPLREWHHRAQPDNRS